MYDQGGVLIHPIDPEVARIDNLVDNLFGSLCDLEKRVRSLVGIRSGAEEVLASVSKTLDSHMAAPSRPITSRRREADSLELTVRSVEKWLGKSSASLGDGVAHSKAAAMPNRKGRKKR